MRCDNCGWPNPEGVERCQKCNQKLRVSVCEEVEPVKTVIPQMPNTATVYCNKCGREYASHMPSCPNCGFTNTELKAAQPLDKSSLKRTVAFNSETPSVQNTDAGINTPSAGEVPPEVLSFGITDKNDLKKTIAAKDFQVAEANQTPAISGIQSLSKEDLRKTVVAFNNEPTEQSVAPNEGLLHNSNKPNLKATIVDVENSALLQKIKANMGGDTPKYTDAITANYTLESMDHDGNEPIVLRISSTAEINLKNDDIVLIGGIRYRSI